MTSSAAQYRILVADDEQAMLDAYRTVLNGANTTQSLDDIEAELFGEPGHGTKAGKTGSFERVPFEVVYCRQGDQAVEAARRAREEGRPFALAFLDVRMPPGPNGVEAAQQIRTFDEDLNIVFVTGFSDVHPRRISQLLPPVERLFYVAKPFQPAELFQFAMTLTHKWKIEQELVDAHNRLKVQYSELEKTNSQLRVAKHEAEAANRTKTEFLANISHELRTPLNAIIGFSDLMLLEPHGTLPDPRYREYLRDIHASGQHLLEIISDILDVSRLEIGKLSLHETETTIADIIDSVMRMVRERTEAAGLSLDITLNEPLPRMRLDTTRMRQVLLNLISNAIKFTDSGGRISIEGNRLSGGDVAIVVSDTGVGMAEDDIPYAMAPFQQVGSVFTRNHQGTGLGLPLSKALIELHGGDMRVESTVGKGTRVTLILPAGRTVDGIS